MKKTLVLLGAMLCVISSCKKEDLPQGSFEAEFSISDYRTVTFSQGNLQYNAVEDCWRFAEHQYDFIGKDNENIGPDYDGWIDLFGWGTSGYLQGPVCYEPGNYYKPQYENGKLNLNHDNGADWGVNRIANGGDQWDMWHTLNDEQWEYIFHFRKDADKKCAQAKINGICGLVILPDKWIQPDGASFSTEGTGWNKNQYTLDEWQVMETSGAVFLPAAGLRDGKVVGAIAENGRYWTASGYSMDWANCMTFFNTDYGTSEKHAKFLGYSVRLVHFCE